MFGKTSQEDALVEQLFTDIVINDLEGVTKLLSKNVPLNTPDTLGRLPIHLAVIKDRANMILLLKENGANLDQRDEKELTPLMLAVKHNALTTAKELLENGANPYLKNIEGKTAEDMAKKTHDALFLKVFENHKKNHYQAKVIRNQNESLKFDQPDKDFNVLLERAEKRQKDIELQQVTEKKQALAAELEKQKSEKLNRIEKTYQAKLKQFRKLATNKETQAKSLSKKNNLSSDEKQENTKYLWNCIQQNDKKQLKELLLAKPSLETVDKEEGWTPLSYALLTNKLEIAQLLLEAGAQVNTTHNGNSLLFHTVKRNKIKDVNLLLAFGANPNLVVDDYSPLEVALENKSKEIVSSLLKHGAQVNYIGKKSAPIVVVIKSNAEDFIQPLIDHGFLVNQLILDRSPLEWCVLHGRERLFKTLIGHAANINIGREDGNALICKIVKSGRYWFLKLMVELGADLNVLDKKGRSPLEIAIVDNEQKMVKILLDGGAMVQLKNADQQTPLQVARRLGRKDIIKLLE